jgi:HD-GYP domain-containing protein (c-di-GMP phosphodiesterase class II)
MSARNASKPPPASEARSEAKPSGDVGSAGPSRRRAPQGHQVRADVQESFEQYTRDLCDRIAQGRSNEDELRAASAQLGIYAADLRRLGQEGQRQIGVVEQSCVELLEVLLCASLRHEEAALRHANATERYAMFFARELGLPDAEEERIGRAARLHDAGKIALSEALLGKRGPLDAGERRALREHCSPGAALAKADASRELQQIGDAIRCHHESWDGSGYPRGLAGDDIPLVARIVKLADVYDTLRDARSYKLALSHAEACRIILEGDERVKPQHFDPRLLERFSDLQQTLEALSGGPGPGGA